VKQQSKCETKNTVTLWYILIDTPVARVALSLTDAQTQSLNKTTYL